MQEMLKKFWTGEQRALARLISVVENEMPEKDELLRQLYPRTGHAYILGVTGSPGAGKSSLVDRLTNVIREKGETVGIVAIDPTSPFSGGALLGDRIRMQEHTLDKGVFIRSMGTRGSLGGLAKTTKEVVKVVDAFGMDWIIIETVGVGQAEMDVMYIADTTVVVLTPGAGDSIQTIKAGIMEIADVFAINKCDLPGADKVATEVEMMLDLQRDQMKWRPPVVKTSSVSREGISDLLEAVEKHRSYLQNNGLFAERRQQRLRSEALEIVNHQWQRLVRRQMNYGKVNELLNSVAAREIDPYSAAASIMEWIIDHSGLKKNNQAEEAV